MSLAHRQRALPGLQPTLDGAVARARAPYRRDHDTQRAGAELASKTGQVARHMREILRVLRTDGPLIREEICQRIPGLKECAACGRLNELGKLGLVKIVGRRKAISGVPVQLYAAT